MAEDWTRVEVEAIVADYFAMLELQLTNKPFNKSERRRTIAPLLSGRSDDSIQYKHRNISAVLDEVGWPSVKGYKPLSNYQGMLADVVLERLRASRHLERIVAADAEVTPALVIPTVDQLIAALVAPPSPDRERKKRARETRRHPYQLRVVYNGINYLEREARNRRLGLAGEEFVVRLEQARLIQAGKDRLASSIEHVSKSRGDGLGYDVLSFETDSRERLIEVKTTKHAKETPFFVSQHEVAVSATERERYQLYRVFDFISKARVFALPGALETTCELEPNSYRARVA